MGRLIPAGTGVPLYHDLTLRVSDTSDSEDMQEMVDDSDIGEPGITSA
jgi:hypothetical protein